MKQSFLEYDHQLIGLSHMHPTEGLTHLVARALWMVIDRRGRILKGVQVCLLVFCGFYSLK